jgi:hypothetical protein
MTVTTTAPRLESFPRETPWGPAEIPAVRKPRWWCAGERCEPSELACDHARRAAAPPDGEPSGPRCEAHVAAVCVSYTVLTGRPPCGPRSRMGSEGCERTGRSGARACFPTAASCEDARRGLRERPPSSGERVDPADMSACAWSDS